MINLQICCSYLLEHANPSVLSQQLKVLCENDLALAGSGIGPRLAPRILLSRQV